MKKVTFWFSGLVVAHIKFICKVHDVMIIIDLLVDPARLRPCWLLPNTHLAPNYNYDIDVFHGCSFKDHTNHFSTYILSIVVINSTGGSQW